MLAFLFPVEDVAAYEQKSLTLLALTWMANFTIRMDTMKISLWNWTTNFLQNTLANSEEGTVAHVANHFSPGQLVTLCLLIVLRAVAGRDTDFAAAVLQADTLEDVARLEFTDTNVHDMVNIVFGDYVELVELHPEKGQALLASLVEEAS